MSTKKYNTCKCHVWQLYKTSTSCTQIVIPTLKFFHNHCNMKCYTSLTLSRKERITWAYWSLQPERRLAPISWQAVVDPITVKRDEQLVRSYDVIMTQGYETKTRIGWWCKFWPMSSHDHTQYSLIMMYSFYRAPPKFLTWTNVFGAQLDIPVIQLWGTLIIHFLVSTCNSYHTAILWIYYYSYVEPMTSRLGSHSSSVLMDPSVRLHLVYKNLPQTPGIQQKECLSKHSKLITIHDISNMLEKYTEQKSWNVGS
jgi:hypothetical protein